MIPSGWKAFQTKHMLMYIPGGSDDAGPAATGRYPAGDFDADQIRRNNKIGKAVCAK